MVLPISRASLALVWITLLLTTHAFPFLQPRQTAAPATTTAVDRTTWQGEELILDPVEECTAYDYPPVDAIIGYYPPVWETASFSFAGVLDEDVAVFTALNSTIPSIPVESIDPTTGVTSGTASSSDPYCWWTNTGCTTPKLAGLNADVSTCPEPNTWGYTLDDGPNCSHNAFYDYLMSVNQKATLFYIGSNVADQPLEGQRGLADGHEVCAHTWSHQYTTGLTNEEAVAELYYSKKMIHDVLGVTVTCWRPPYGDVDDRIRFIAQALGLTTVIWDHDTNDWNYATVGISAVEANYESIINASYATGGTIVLSHELDNETMALSEQFLPEIQAKFTGGVMPVGACQNWTAIYGEGSQYAYPNYAQWVAGTRTISPPTPTAYSSEIPLATDLPVTSA